MAYSRRSRRASMMTSKPLVAFLLIASFGVLFGGCSSSEPQPEEVVFTQEELDRARELSGRGGTALSGSGTALDTTLTGTGTAPVVDLSLVPLFNSIRSGPSTLGNPYRVTFDFVNIRSEPRVTAQTVGRKQRGESFDVIDFVNSGWAKVRTENDGEGYVSTQYLAKVVTEEKLLEEKKKFEGLYVVDYEFLNVRKEPRSSSELVGKLPAQSVVRPLVFENEWAKIVFEGKEGYISKDYLVEFLPTMLVRQERFTLPMLVYDASQPDALDALVIHATSLRSEGLTLVTLRDFYDVLIKQEERDARLDSKNVAMLVTGVTADNVAAVTQALASAKVRATVFLQTRHVGLSGITERAILSLVAGGHDVQSAGHTGDDLRSLTNGQVDLELKQSRAIIEDITRKPVFAFLYPLGSTNDRVMQMAAQSGYLFGVTTDGNRVFSRDMLLRLPAMAVSPTALGDEVLKMVTGSGE